MTLRKALLLGLAAPFLTALPSSADWLVTVDGGKIETKGPWKVEGQKITFTLPNGSLGILRKSEVDLDASAVATSQVQPPPSAAKALGPESKKKADPEVKKTSRKPVLTLTDKDVPRYAGDPAAPVGGAPATAGAPVAATSAAKPVKPQALVVESWQRVDAADGDGSEIVGVLRNRGGDFESAISMTVEVTDGSGNKQRATGFVSQPGILAGTTATFRALFPSVYEVAGEPVFNVKSDATSLDVPPPPPLPPTDGGGE
jgi:hypothetical protein